MKCGHNITQVSDFKDKNGNGYIIRCKTMEPYLNQKFGQGKQITSLLVYGPDPKDKTKQILIKAYSGIIHFDQITASNATGHFDVVVKGKVTHKDYSHDCKRMIIWEC